MLIQFKCPHCGEIYRVRDEFAGKRTKCRVSTCQQFITVPVPKPEGLDGKPKSTVAEQMAAALLAEESETEKQKKSAPIQFNCPQCDEPLEVDRGRAGKNMPCPSCRNIVRIPIPKEDKPVDWRQAKSPLAAQQETAEGVWSTEDSRYVSGEALQKAEAIEIEYEPLPWSYRLRNWSIVLAGVLGLGVLGLLFVQWRGEQAEQFTMEQAEVALKEALNELQGTAKTQLAPTWTAGIHTAKGLFTLRNATEQAGRDEAMRLFATARGELDTVAPSLDRNGQIIELLRAQVHLGGNEDQVGLETRYDWDAVQRELRQTFTLLQAADRDTQVEALRQLTQWLQPLGQSERAARLVRVLSSVPAWERAELLAQVGLERFRAGDRAGAEQMAELAQANMGNPGAAGFQSPVTLQALWLGLAGAEPLPKERRLLPPPSERGEPNPLVRQAYALGLALQGKTQEAIELASRTGRPEARLRAMLAVAEIVQDQGGEIEALLSQVGEVLAPRAEQPRSSPWWSIRLVRLLAATGARQQADTFLAALSDASLRAWCGYAMLAEQVANQGNPPLPQEAATSVPGDSVAGGQARLAWARHQVAVDGADAVRAMVEAWPVQERAFGFAGLALGLQDRDGVAE